ncbi:Lipocalin-like domain-containing protein [Spirosomataceae bacterium TFI 002]|nr:Lipocalin-like domain-containing protein [Spirosomataceae bacterium TFI 002]
MKKLLFLPLFALLFNACTSSDVEPKKEFVGKWKINSFQVNLKMSGEQPENEVEDVSGKEIILEFKEDGTFTSSYVPTGDEDFELFPVSTATYSVQNDEYILISSKNEMGDNETIKYKYEINNDQLVLSMDKELVKEAFANALKLEAAALAAFGITAEDLLLEIFVDIESYDLSILMVKAN